MSRKIRREKWIFHPQPLWDIPALARQGLPATLTARKIAYLSRLEY
jgi:hypothetical protein